MQDTRDRLRAAALHWAETAPVADIDVPADLQHLPPQWAWVVDKGTQLFS